MKWRTGLRVLGGLALGALAGLAGGEAWIRGVVKRSPTITPTPASRADLGTNATAPPKGSGSHEVKAPPRENFARSPEHGGPREAAPSPRQPDRPKVAQAPFAKLYGKPRSLPALVSEYDTTWAEAGDQELAARVERSGAATRLEEGRRRQIEYERQRTAELGPAPWAGVRSQLFVFCPADPVWRYGADYVPYASAEASGQWFAKALHVESQARLTEATEALAEYERLRRDLQAAIVRRIQGWVSSAPQETGVAAWVICSGHIYVFRLREVPGLEAILHQAEVFWPDALTRAADALRSGD